MIRRLTVATLLLVCLPCLAQPVAPLQDSLQKRLAGRVMTIRHFYEGILLRYDAQGKLKAHGVEGPWTTGGEVEPSQVHIEGDHLQIDAIRLLARWNGKKRVMQFARTKDPVKIVIDFDGTPMEAYTVDAALNGVFLGVSEPLSSVAPEFWRPYLRGIESEVAAGAKSKNLALAPVPPGKMRTVVDGSFRDVYGPVLHTSTDGEKVYSPAAVTRPTAVTTADPSYSEAGRLFKIDCTTRFYAEVDRSGETRNLAVENPCGFGLDEKAFDAISGWKFQPASKDGETVSVGLSVEVKFHVRRR